jgi:uncharacterized protein YdiU (UPF0061 family)
MNAVNAKYVLRNWVAEDVIRAAEDRNDMRPLNALLGVLLRPYDDHGAAFERYCAPVAPEQIACLSVSCSS